MRARARPHVGPPPLIDLRSGYVLRSIGAFPAQGSRRPWRMHQSYAMDKLELGFGAADDGVMRFSTGARGRSPSPVVPAVA